MFQWTIQNISDDLDFFWKIYFFTFELLENLQYSLKFEFFSTCRFLGSEIDVKKNMALRRVDFSSITELFIGSKVS